MLKQVNFRSIYFLLTTLLILLVGIFIYFLFYNNRVELDSRIEALSGAILKQANSYILVVNSARDLMASPDLVNLSSWEEYFNNLDLKKNYRGISSVAYSEWIHKNDKDAYAAELRNIYKDSGIKIYPNINKGDHLLIVKFVSPLSSELKRAIGLDVVNLPDQFEAIQQAIKTGLPTLSTRSVFSVTGRVGFSITEPIYDRNSRTATEIERQEAFGGVIGAAFNSGDFFGEIFRDYPLENLRVKVYDGTELTDKNLFYDTNPEGGEFVSIGKREIKVLNALWTISYGLK